MSLGKMQRQIQTDVYIQTSTNCCRDAQGTKVSGAVLMSLGIFEDIWSFRQLAISLTHKKF